LSTIYAEVSGSAIDRIQRRVRSRGKSDLKRGYEKEDGLGREVDGNASQGAGRKRR